MKNVFILFFLVFSFSLCFSDGFFTYGEVSFLPNLVMQEKTDIYDKDNLNFYTSIGIGYEYKFLYAETELNTHMVKADSYMFQPYTQEYLIRVGVDIKKISIQYEHICAHSIDGLGDNYGQDKISIMFDTRNE